MECPAASFAFAEPRYQYWKSAFHPISPHRQARFESFTLYGTGIAKWVFYRTYGSSVYARFGGRVTPGRMVTSA